MKKLHFFGSIIGVYGLGFGKLFLGIITTVLKDTLPITDLVQSSLMILPIMIVVQAIMLPFQLKFGGDKGRIAMIGVLGGLESNHSRYRERSRSHFQY